MNHKLYSAHENSHWIYETECFLSSSIRDEEFASHPHAFIQMFQQNSIMSQKWASNYDCVYGVHPLQTLKKDDNDNG
jgi:hypothetical protein